MDSSKGRNERSTRVSRRTYLGAIGLAAASSGLVGTATGAGQYHRVVDMVEAGADNTGQRLIDDVFEKHARDDTLLKFPPGTYRANELIIYKLSNFAMVGEDATLLPGPNYREDVWLGGGNVRNVRIENFTIDNTGRGVAPEVDISAFDGLTVRNVHKKGFHEGTGVAFAFQVLDRNGGAFIERVTAPDGGKAVGMYIKGEGPITVRNCHIEGFTNNGLYASHCNAAVTVEGGTFKDNNIAQVRLGSPNSSLTGATLEVTRPVKGPDSDVVNMRGVRIADGAGPVTVEDCDISMRGAEGTGGIVTAFSGGSLHVANTDIHVDREYTTPSSNGSRTSWGVFVDDPGDGYSEGERTFRNVSITGGGRYMSGMLIRRSNNTVDGLCLDQTGEGRDGIIFQDSTNNRISGSTIDVTDRAIVMQNSSARKSNVSYEGSCSPTSEGKTTASAGTDGEVGGIRTDQPTPERWHSVRFSRSYDRPVVISKPLSHAGRQPCHVRIRGVGSSGYEFKLEEWQYLDGTHVTENASYLVVDAATTTRGIAAGTVRAGHRFARFDWVGSFDGQPVVFTQAQTVRGSDPIVTRLRNVTRDGAEVRVQEEDGEENGGYHHQETVGYVALERGTGSVGGRTFEADFVEGGVDDGWRRVDFDGSYDTPRFVAGVQSYAGPNAVNLRYRNLTSTGVDVFLEEERSADSETSHRFERVGYAVFEGA